MKFKNIKQAKRKKAPSVKKPQKKKIGESGRNRQFPSIYRFITERKEGLNSIKNKFRLSNQSKLKKLLFFVSAGLVLLVVLILVFGIVFLGVYAFKYSLQAGKINNQRQDLQTQVNFWQSIADKYEGYKDAYFRIAVLEYQLGDFQKSKDYNKKALLLDPNFDDAKKLEVVLENK